MTTINKISAYTAVLAAIAYAQLTEEETSDISVRRIDGLYEIRFSSDWSEYDCFVDELSAEVLGFDSRPLSEHAMLSECRLMTA